MEQELYATLDALGINYEKIEHDAFPTVEASGSFYADHDMGVDCKNAFMRNRRGKKHYLVTLLAGKTIDIPALAEVLGENRKMGFASEERLAQHLGLTPGSVTPFALLHENAQGIPIVVDAEIFTHEYVHFHPMRNTATLKITTKDFRRFLEAHASEVIVQDFTLS